MNLLHASLALAILALARPQRVISYDEVKTEGIAIVVACDVSLSMLIQDFYIGSTQVNRLTAAKRVLHGLHQGPAWGPHRHRRLRRRAVHALPAHARSRLAAQEHGPHSDRNHGGRHGHRIGHRHGGAAARPAKGPQQGAGAAHGRREQFRQAQSAGCRAPGRHLGHPHPHRIHRHAGHAPHPPATTARSSIQAGRNSIPKPSRRSPASAAAPRTGRRISTPWRTSSAPSMNSKRPRSCAARSWKPRSASGGF